MTMAQRIDYQLVLNDQERAALRRILEQALLDARREASRTEALTYREYMHEQLTTLEGLVEKVRQLARQDIVEQASEQSFLASDAPSWTPVQSLGPPGD